MAREAKFNIYSPKNLTKGLNAVLIQQLAKKYNLYQSRWLIILIGISKMINATVLMMLYSWKKTWDEKFLICLFFVVLSCITYAAEYLIALLWWPRYMGTFWHETSPVKFIICAGSPSYSGKYKISFHKTNSTTFFQKLKKPVVEEEIEFSKYFTESGYMVTDEWRSKCNELIDRALKVKEE